MNLLYIAWLRVVHQHMGAVWHRAGYLARHMAWPALVALWLWPAAAHAQLFADNEARHAILDLRQRYLAVSEENAQLRQSLQELRAEVRSLTQEHSKLRTRHEQIVRDLGELQQRRNDEESLSLLAAPAAISADIGSPTSMPAQQTQFEMALAHFRQRDYSTARTHFQQLLQQTPHDPLHISAQFWLGQSDYALRRYRAAIKGFRTVVELDATHKRAPEALLGIANSQARLGEYSNARNTLAHIVQQYPRSEAAQVARDRLKRLQ